MATATVTVTLVLSGPEAKALEGLLDFPSQERYEEEIEYLDPILGALGGE